MALNNFPASDQNVTNLDWILRKIQEFNAKLTDFYSKEFQELLNQIYLNSSYDPETQTITLTLDVKKEE